jgi:molybdopterin synthase catalytic subunit
MSIIRITREPISPQSIFEEVKTSGSGCVATYIGLIRDNSHGKIVKSVEYIDIAGNAVNVLSEIADEVKARWRIEDIGIVHRIGKLRVGDINFLVAIAAGHREEGFEACRFVVDSFKERLPTRKTETYTDSTTLVGGKD